MATLTVEGDRWVMRNAHGGHHTLLCATTDAGRLGAHWGGFAGPHRPLPVFRFRSLPNAFAAVSGGARIVREGKTFADVAGVPSVQAIADAAQAAIEVEQGWAHEDTEFVQAARIRGFEAVMDRAYAILGKPHLAYVGLYDPS